MFDKRFFWAWVEACAGVLTNTGALGAFVSQLERNSSTKQTQALFFLENRIGRIKGETQVKPEI